MEFKVQQLNTQIKAHLEHRSFSKDNVHCLQPIYIMLQVGKITYLMITDDILILHFEITAYTAYTWYKWKIEEDMFLERYIHLIQSINIRVQISTHQRFCLQLIVYVVHRRNRGYTAYIANKRK